MIVSSPESRNEYKELIKQNAKATIVVKFYANWCVPCKNISSLVETRFQQIKNKKLMILVNVDEEKDVASFMKVRSLPTLISYKNGERDNVCMSGNPDDIHKFFDKL